MQHYLAEEKIHEPETAAVKQQPDLHLDDLADLDDAEIEEITQQEYLRDEFDHEEDEERDLGFIVENRRENRGNIAHEIRTDMVKTPAGEPGSRLSDRRVAADAEKDEDDFYRQSMLSEDEEPAAVDQVYPEERLHLVLEE